MSLPRIQSVGPPPQMHADRVVAEMLRFIVEARVSRLRQLKQILKETSDGNPKAQSKLAKKIEDASGRPFMLAVKLQTGTRGRYKLDVHSIDGWDAASKKIISENDRIPEKPWLACTCVKIIGKGRGLYDDEGYISLFVTHHALSRLVQRCGVEDLGHLLAVVHDIWWSLMNEKRRRKEDADWPRDGSRLKFPLPKTTLAAFAVLERYADIDGGLVVVTILDEKSPG